MKKKKKIFLLVSAIIIISLSLIFKYKTNNEKVRTPKPDEISSITFIRVINDRGVEKREVYKNHI